MDLMYGSILWILWIMDKKDGAAVFLELDRPSNASFPPDNDKDNDNDKDKDKDKDKDNDKDNDN